MTLTTTDAHRPSPKQAARRYIKLTVFSMSAYVISVFCVVGLIRGNLVTGPLIYPLALLPGLAGLAFLYGYFRFINEMDELARKIQIEATMIAVAAMLTFTLTWGLMEMFIDDMVRIPMFWVFPFYFGVQGVASGFLSRRYGVACETL